MAPLPPPKRRSGKRTLFMLSLSAVAAALGVLSLLSSGSLGGTEESPRGEEKLVSLEGPRSARALMHLPVLPYDTEDFDVAIAVHPRFGMPLSKHRLLLSVSESATVAALDELLREERLRIVGSIGCALSLRHEGRVLRPGERGMPGVEDFVLGTVLVSLPESPDASDFSSVDALMERLWKSEAITSVGYVAPWGVSFARLPGPPADRAKNWLPRLQTPAAQVREVEGIGIPHAAGRLTITFEDDATVAHANEALRESEVLVIGGLGDTGLLFGAIAGAVYDGGLTPTWQVRSLRAHRAVQSASAAFAASLQSSGGPAKPPPPGAGAPPPEARTRMKHLTPIACPPEKELAPGELTHRRLFAQEASHFREPVAFLARAEKGLESWPGRLAHAVREARPPMRFDRETALALQLPPKQPSELEVQSIAVVDDTARIRIVMSGRLTPTFGPSLAIAIPAQVERVEFLAADGQVIAQAPDPTSEVPVREIARVTSPIRAGVWLVGDPAEFERQWRETSQIPVLPKVNFEEERVVIASLEGLGELRDAARGRDGTVRIRIQRLHGGEGQRRRVIALAVPPWTTRVELTDEEGRPLHSATAELVGLRRGE